MIKTNFEHSLNVEITNLIIRIKLSCQPGIYFLSFESNKILNMEINQTEILHFKNPGLYNVNCISDENGIQITITRSFNLEIQSFDHLFKSFQIFKYGEPPCRELTLYQIVYSFDRNYLAGGFASINSLILNFKGSMNDLLLNICIPYEDANLIIDKFYDYFQLKCKCIFHIISDCIIPDEIRYTKCFKGGNHLLQLSNFTRLTIGHFINSDRILYLDADTIILSDLSNI